MLLDLFLENLCVFFLLELLGLFLPNPTILINLFNPFHYFLMLMVTQKIHLVNLLRVIRRPFFLHMFYLYLQSIRFKQSLLLVLFFYDFPLELPVRPHQLSLVLRHIFLLQHFSLLFLSDLLLRAYLSLPLGDIQCLLLKFFENLFEVVVFEFYCEFHRVFLLLDLEVLYVVLVHKFLIRFPEDIILDFIHNYLHLQNNLTHVLRSRLHEFKLALNHLSGFLFDDPSYDFSFSFVLHFFDFFVFLHFELELRFCWFGTLGKGDFLGFFVLWSFLTFAF